MLLMERRIDGQVIGLTALDICMKSETSYAVSSSTVGKLRQADPISHEV